MRVRPPAHARNLLVPAAVLTVFACNSDGTKPAGPDLPDTPDELVAELRNAYEHRQLDRMGQLLFPEYEFQFDPVDIDTLGLDTLWTRERDLAAAKLMWEGSSGIWPDGSWHAPVDLRFPFGLQINAVDSVWVPGVGEDAGMLTRVYRSGMTVQYDDGNLDIVTGRQQFFVVEVPQRGWAVRKWIDLGGSLGAGDPDAPSKFAASDPEPGTATVDTNAVPRPVLVSAHVTSWGYVRGVFRQPGPE